MAHPDLAFVTFDERPGVDDDDQPLEAALAALGLGVVAVSWSDPAFDWSRPRAAVVRSTWDYHLRRDDFVAWAAACDARTPLWNPPDVLAWNTHKSYLQRIRSMGVPVVDTELVPCGTDLDLGALLAERGWSRAVVKPAVSIGSWRTIEVRAPVTPDDAGFARALARERDVLVQPFVATVETSGERCLVAVEGEVVHAVRKQPRFSRAERAAPSVEPADPALDERALAHDVLAAAGASSLPYARVDMARDEAGRPVLMELELTEPRLYLRLGGERSAGRLARALADRLD